MTDQATNADGQVDTTATTQGSAAAPADTAQTTTLLGDAGEESKAVDGAAPTDGTKPEDGAGKDEGQNGKGAEATKDDKAVDKGDGAPAEYADFTAPEGVSMDPAVMGDFKSLAKDLKLSQEKAQQVADLGVKLVQRTQQAQAQALQQEVANWATASQKDQEFGGEKLQENLAGAKAALDQFGSPELKTMLNQSGLGNHPEVIRLLHRVNKAVSEDTILRGQATKGAASIAQQMYPKMNP